MKYLLIIASVLVFLALLVILVIQLGTSAYMRGYKDGELMKGRQLAAMIYLKPRLVGKSQIAMDAWDLVDAAKDQQLESLEVQNIYLYGIREIAVSGYQNYTPAFENGIAPKDAFVLK